ncbi:MAG: c-type cytochrome biogenesis protein CcmI [Burkholderiales bacterium]|jgi:cytochrome c-type biogenesis protein CcmH|nr:c-type cytochrome biogenesis protein CcmI [Burkholderiales bacterium]
MTAFFAIAVFMTAVALALIVRPLLFGVRARSGVARAASNLDVLKDQVAELESDLRAGTISEVQYREARAELERRVLEEARAEPGEKSAPTPRGVATALALIVLLPLVAGLMYWQFGTPSALSPEAQQLAAQGGDAHQFTPEEIEKMIARAEDKLKQNPDDAQGWAVLARTYYSMQRFPEAARAFAELARLVPNDADVLADYADTLAMAQGRTLTGKPMELVQRALKADPNHWKALALAGSDAMNRKDYKTALAYWERLAVVVPAGSEMAQAVASNIAEARDLGGIKAPTATAAKPALTAPSAPAAPVAGAAAVGGTVSLSPALAAKVNPDDAVFIFARPAEGARMPLAIIRKQVKDLPATFSLDDSMAMAPNMKLSGFADVVVGARVSKTGSAMPQAGDFEGLSTPVKTGTANLAIVIDKVVP